MQAQSCEQLIWSDEFEGTALDTNYWSFEIGDGCPDLCGWGNSEQQYYSDSQENIRVENGSLVITAKEDILGGLSYSSARITSLKKIDFRYGRFEARIKMPKTQGMWPAFWMLPTEKVYGGWPRSGEMDIIEMIGSKPGRAVGTLHTGLPHTYISGYYDLPTGETFADSFHVFTMEWEPDSINFLVDGIKYHQLTPNDISPWEPFLEDFYLILNLAVGGQWPGPVDPTTELPQTLEVDYVRVYNRPERLSIKGSQPMVEAVGLEYSTYDIVGANYIWTVPSDATISSGQGTNKIAVDWGCTVGNVELELQTDCDTVTLYYDVLDFVIPTLVGSNIVTENQSGLIYSTSQASGGTFSWEVPPGSSIVSGQGSSQIIVDWGCDLGEVRVAFESSCGTNFKDTMLVDFPDYAINGQSSVLANATNRTYSIGQIPDATYLWSVTSNANIVSGQNTPSVEIDFGISDGVIAVVVESVCGINSYELPFVIEESFLYVDFDSVDLEFIPYDGAIFQKVDNPSPSGINISENVGRVNKETGAEYWAGVEANVQEIPLDLRPVMTQKVYSTKSGTVRFMLDDETTGSPRLKIDMEYSPSDVNKWVQLVYDFTGSPSEIYDQLRLTYNHFSTSTEFWYFDEVMAWSNFEVSNSVDQEMISLIAVYPNPSSGLFLLDTKDVFPMGGTYDLQVLNSLGQAVLIQKLNLEGQPVVFDLSDQPIGMYFLRLRGESLFYVKAIQKID